MNQKLRMLVAALIAATVVGAGYWSWTRFDSAASQTKLATQTQDVQTELVSRIKSYERLLENVRVLSTSQGIKPADWDKYFTAVHLGDYPGLSAVSFSLRVRAADRAAYESQYGHKIFPASTKAEYYPLTALAPSAGREKFFGFDSSSVSSSQYKWVELARDTGRTERSDAYYFTSMPGTFGLLETLPLYDRSKPVDTVEARQKAYAGLIQATFTVAQLGDTLSSGPAASQFPSFEIYDKTDPDAQKIFSREPARQLGPNPVTERLEVPFGNRPIEVVLSSARPKLSPPLWWLVLALPAAGLAAWLAARWRPA